MQQAMLYALLLVMQFALLSGLTTPFSGMPESLQAAMVINPLRYALEVTNRVYLSRNNLRLPSNRKVRGPIGSRLCSASSSQA